jgi:hypothetical protein
VDLSKLFVDGGPTGAHTTDGSPSFLGEIYM